MSAVMIALCTASAVRIIAPAVIFGREGFLNDEKTDFYSMSAVADMVEEDARRLGTVCGGSPDSVKKYYSEIKDDIISSALNSYLDKKARIIESEFEYVAGNYRENPEEYDSANVSDEYIAAIPDTDAGEQKYPVDPYAPNAVKAVQKILNCASGRELLKYESIVRDEAFRENQFVYEYRGFNGSYERIFIENYLSNEEQVREIISQNVDESINSGIKNIEHDIEMDKDRLESLENVKYYARIGETVYTNLDESEADFSKASGKELYYVKKYGESDSSPSLSKTRLDDALSDCDCAFIYCVDEIEISGNDEIATAKHAYDLIDTNKNVITSVIFFVLAVLAAVCLLNLSGHKNGYDGIKLSFIDKVPADLHLIACGAVMICSVVIASVAVKLYYLDNFSRSLLCAVPAAAAVIWLAALEYLASIVRLKKADRKIYKTTFIYFIIKKVFGFFSSVIPKIKKIIRNSALRYRPQQIRKRYIFLFAAFIMLNVFVFFISALVCDSGGMFLLLGILALVIIDAAAISLSSKYFKDLDRIITAGKKRESVDFSGEKVADSLNTLNEILRVSNNEVKEAVDKAVKNERTKAELITNVSHDLKTPLTSIVNYVDLLRSRDIGDEQAKEYIEILGEKADNLKHLIENLVEASKVSAGNVQLNKTMLNLKELAIQADVEFMPEFESRGLDLRFNESCEAVTVYADSRQTYRILENLLSNAKKYSAEGTRVYETVRKENGFGVYEIKNISSEPLNISADELTERFVRGDASRGREEGNGLGLSIAKELCELQNGKLVITIDGDLFKAEVFLPLDNTEIL